MAEPDPHPKVSEAGRPLWLIIAAVYLIGSGLVMLASQVIVHLQYFSEPAQAGQDFQTLSDFVPWWLRAFGACAALFRIAAGVMLFGSSAQAVVMCGVAVTALAASLLVVPFAVQLAVGVVMAPSGWYLVTNIGELLVLCLIWWSAFDWCARGHLRDQRRSGATELSLLDRVRVMLVTLMAVQVSAAIVYFPALLETVRTGEVNVAIGMLVLMSSVLLAIGTVSVARARASARYVLAVAVILSVPTLLVTRQFASAVLVAAAGGFFFAVRQSAARRGS